MLFPPRSLFKYPAVEASSYKHDDRLYNHSTANFDALSTLHGFEGTLLWQIQNYGPTNKHSLGTALPPLDKNQGNLIYPLFSLHAESLNTARTMNRCIGTYHANSS